MITMIKGSKRDIPIKNTHTTLILDLKTFFSIFIPILNSQFSIFNSIYDIIQPVSHSRVAQIQVFSHIFEAAAAFDELQDELLVVGRKTRQNRQIVQTCNFGLAGFAFQALHFELRLATWTITW
jgi:hypothetical protein